MIWTLLNTAIAECSIDKKQAVFIGFNNGRYIKTSEMRGFATWGVSLSVYNNIHVDTSSWEKSHLFVCRTNLAWLERKNKEEKWLYADFNFSDNTL